MKRNLRGTAIKLKLVFHEEEAFCIVDFKGEKEITDIVSLILFDHKIHYRDLGKFLEFTWGYFVHRKPNIYAREDRITVNGRHLLFYWFPREEFAEYLKKIDFSIPLDKVYEIYKYTIHEFAKHFGLKQSSGVLEFYVEFKVVPKGVSSARGWKIDKLSLLSYTDPFREINSDEILKSKLDLKVASKLWEEYLFAYNFYEVLQVVRWTIELLGYGFDTLKESLLKEIKIKYK